MKKSARSWKGAIKWFEKVDLRLELVRQARLHHVVESPKPGDTTYYKTLRQYHERELGLMRARAHLINRLRKLSGVKERVMESNNRDVDDWKAVKPEKPSFSEEGGLELAA